MLNVYTGESYPAGVATRGDRIAYVGVRDDMIGPRTRVVDARCRVIVPGYIDPHVHPATLTTPAALARFVLPLGTTAVVADTLQFWELGGLAAFRRVADALRASPLRFYWMIRPHAQSRAPGEWRRFDLTALASRLMLTSDGSMPAFIRTHGFVDHLIRVALERGVAPVDAYRMATLNPATYYGLDADVGGVAPGRYADICLLEDLSAPRPATVIAHGKVVAAGGRLLARVPEPPWRRVFTSAEARLAVRWRASPGDFELPARERYPVIKLVSAVISRLQERPMEPGDLHAALLDRGGRWVAPGVVAGFAEGLDGFAATTSTDFNILVLGRRPEALARAVNRLLDLHGGIVLVDGDQIAYELPLPLGGIMTRGTVDEAAGREDE